MSKKFEVGYLVCMHTLGDGEVVDVTPYTVTIRFNDANELSFDLRSNVVSKIMYGRSNEVFGNVKEGDPIKKTERVSGFTMCFYNTETKMWQLYSTPVTLNKEAIVECGKGVYTLVPIDMTCIKHAQVITQSKQTFDVMTK